MLEDIAVAMICMFPVWPIIGGAALLELMCDKIPFMGRLLDAAIDHMTLVEYEDEYDDYDNYDEWEGRKVIREYIGEAAMWEQLAEEAVELAHAAQKMARIIRGENPTPLRGEDAATQIEEEWTDVILCGMELKLTADPKEIYQKQKRFVERAQEREKKRMQEHTDK